MKTAVRTPNTGMEKLTKTQGTVQRSSPAASSKPGRKNLSPRGGANISQGGEKTKLGLGRANKGRQNL
jgi:hypothetical protein